MDGKAVRVAGFGFRAAATEASLADALDRAGGPAGLTALAVPADKAGAAGIAALAARLALPLCPVAGAELTRPATATRSAHSLAHRGAGSVAEAAALAACGEGARLLGPRRVSNDRMSTCAIATKDLP
ncbi:cobalamin biosynthesis protein [Rhodovulum sulfidophilum]|uniref:cobalamin biosynthesis protein n=1 Tax=Rhodovulum sulfidophilum TaxID=35806 RepID=UPI0026A13080|nr:cobalamin biosynthesis protein [Rhodovulum sulfidophilum]